MGDEKSKVVAFTGKDGYRAKFEVVKPIAPFLAKMGLTFEGPVFGGNSTIDSKRAPREFDDYSDQEEDRACLE